MVQKGRKSHYEGLKFVLQGNKNKIGMEPNMDKSKLGLERTSISGSNEPQKVP